MSLGTVHYAVAPNAASGVVWAAWPAGHEPEHLRASLAKGKIFS